MEDEMMEAIKQYSEALKNAEKNDKHEFECPLCGGNAWWGRSEINNHLHSVCKKCGFKMFE